MWIAEIWSKKSPQSSAQGSSRPGPLPNLAVWTLALSILLSASGCSSAPEDEQTGAVEAVERARQAGAAEYAPASLTRATDELALAQAEFSSQRAKKVGFLRRFGKSQELFAHTVELAEAAEAEAVTEKARVNRELDALVEELRTRTKHSQEIVDGDAWTLFRNRSSDPGAMMELEDELSVLEDAQREVESAIANGDTERALRVGRAALDQLRTLETLIDETSKTGKVSFRFEK